MALRLVVSMKAEPGKRCEQFEMYQNIASPDQFVLLERWADQESLTAHGQLTQDRRAAMASLRTVVGEAERYTS